MFLQHDFFFNNIPDAVGLPGILADDLDPVRKFSVGGKNDPSLISHKRNVVIFFLVPTI